MRVLLVDIIRTSIDSVWPSAEYSLGLMYIASALKQRLGRQVRTRLHTVVSRAGHEPGERQDMLELLERWAPDVVGFRSLSIGKDVLRRMVDVTKDWNERCPVIVGGPHATDAPTEVLMETRADCAVVGEGELTAIDLVERFLAGRGIDDVPGIALRGPGGPTRTAPRPLIADLDSLPIPDYSLVDQGAFQNRYLTFSSRVFQPHGNILTSRGCPYRCAYCHNILGKRFRARSAESVVAEIRYLRDRYGFRDFQIIDDIFNLDGKRAHRVCDLIIGGDLDVTLSFPNGVRGDLLDRELVEKMAAAGTKFMSIAVETASPRLQKLIGKNLALDRVFRAIELAAGADIITRGFFMLGFPSETESEAWQTAQFAIDSDLAGATFFTVVYFPGTPLFELARSMGYLQDDGCEVRRDYVQVGEGPYEFSAETLAALKRRAVREFAFTRRRIDNALQMLPSYFSQREINALLMAYVVSSGCKSHEIEDEYVRTRLRRHFAVAEGFSKQGAFYV